MLKHSDLNRSALKRKRNVSRKKRKSFSELLLQRRRESKSRSARLF